MNRGVRRDGNPVIGGNPTEKEPTMAKHQGGGQQGISLYTANSIQPPAFHSGGAWPARPPASAFAVRSPPFLHHNKN